MCLQFGFVIFWQKDFGAKAAHKMLVKLTPELSATATILHLPWLPWAMRHKYDLFYLSCVDQGSHGKYLN